MNIMSDKGFDRARPGRSVLVLIGAAAVVLVVVVAVAATARLRSTADASPASAPSLVSSLDPSVLNLMQETLTTAIPDAAAGDIETVALAADDVSPAAARDAADVTSAYTLSQIGDARQWRLFVSVSDSEDVGIAGCDRDSASYSCTATETPDGTEVVRRFVSIARPELGDDKYSLISPAEVTEATLPELRVEMVVQLSLRGGGRLSAWDTVYAPRSTDLGSVFTQDSQKQLISLLHQPDLLDALRSGDRAN